MKFETTRSKTRPPGRTKGDRHSTGGIRHIFPAHITKLFNKLYMKPEPHKRKKVVKPTGYCKNTRCGKKLPELTATLKPYKSKYCCTICGNSHRSWSTRQL